MHNGVISSRKTLKETFMKETHPNQTVVLCSAVCWGNPNLVEPGKMAHIKVMTMKW